MIVNLFGTASPPSYSEFALKQTDNKKITDNIVHIEANRTFENLFVDDTLRPCNN